MKSAFNRQLDALSTLWSDPSPMARVYFIGEVQGLTLAVYYCLVEQIDSLSKDWILLKLAEGDSMLPRLQRKTGFQ